MRLCCGGFTAQLAAVMRLTPLSITANLLSAVAVVVAFWRSAPPTFLLPWSLAIVGWITLFLDAWHRLRRRRADAQTRGDITRQVLIAAYFGLVWAMPPVWIYPGADNSHQVFLAWLVF